jgi:hypothetical protein
MSRTEAKKAFTQDDPKEQTSGVERRKDRGVVDEIPVPIKTSKASCVLRTTSSRSSPS